MNDLKEAAESPYFISVVAGIAGALLAAYRLLPGKNFGEKTLNFAAGSLLATFCAPGAVDYFNIKLMGLAMLMGFTIGLFGLSLMAAITSGIREVKFGEIISGWLSRRG